MESITSAVNELNRSEVLLTRRQVAKRLGLCTHSVRALERRGLLPRVQLTRRTIRYKQTDVEKLINEAMA